MKLDFRSRWDVEGKGLQIRGLGHITMRPDRLGQAGCHGKEKYLGYGVLIIFVTAVLPRLWIKLRKRGAVREDSDPEAPERGLSGHLQKIL